ncbi:MAG TPA: glycosyltransferase [Steroidobacteraceae bacterium]|jgi:glycosyltransferase involved in cell wall biosynthesis
MPNSVDGGARVQKGSALSVLVLNNFCHAQGGASRVAIDEAVGLAHSGARVVFLGAVGPVCPELQHAPLEVVCLEQRELATAGGRAGVLLQGLWNAKAYRAVQEVLSRLDPDNTVVHLHGFTQALSTSPIRCAVDGGYASVYTLHDFFLACPNGAFFDYQAREPCTRQALSLDCITTQCDKRNYAQKLYRVARSSIQRSIGHLPAGVKDYIALSRRSAEVLRPYLPADAKIHSVSNPIEVAKREPVDVARNTRVVAVGRLDPEKGIDVLARAARQTGTPLTLIGDGPLREQLAAGESCRVTGWIPREAVLAELEAARCLVFPSLWYETYGLAVSEAAARGIPAIVSDISAAAERVRDGMTGWHARAGDVEDLARRLELVKDDATVERAGRAAYEQYWSNPPTLAEHIAKLTDVYSEILARRRPASAGEG